MQQRTAIARALANDPEILLLDEPFGALDNQTRALMQELLLGIWERERKTVLFVTHDIEEAIFLASRVVVMTARPGRIKADVAIDLPHPRHYTIKTSPEFSALKARLTEEIRVEAVLAARGALMVGIRRRFAREPIARGSQPCPRRRTISPGRPSSSRAPASGIGRATALIFAREGANVVCADLNEAGARADRRAGHRQRRQGAGAAHRRHRRAREVDDMVRQAIDAFGTVQFQFNSAGAALRRSKFLDIDEALLDNTFALNVKGTFYCMQAILPHMEKNRLGVIVNMASMAHRRGGPGSSIHYAAAKGAVVSMTLGVAREFAHLGIRCLSISPGPVKTPFQAAAQTSPELVQRFLDDVPMKRFGEPEEIGELVLFMCSDACSFMTADTVYVSGGGGWR